MLDLANPPPSYEVLGRLREGSGLIAVTFHTAGGPPGGGSVIEFDPAEITPGNVLARGRIVPTDEFLSQPACEGVEID